MYMYTHDRLGQKQQFLLENDEKSVMHDAQVSLINKRLFCWLMNLHFYFNNGAKIIEMYTLSLSFIDKISNK